MKRFNVTGVCVPRKHYMVDISNKIKQIKKMIDYGQYFTINQPRQYGKTTTLSLLHKFLQDEYTVIRISFEGVGDTMFENPPSFCERFLWQIDLFFKQSNIKSDLWQDNNITDFDLLSEHINKMCSGKKIILMIDEVDKTSNNRVFIQFLGLLRNRFLLRSEDMGATFHSVILVGVYDIKNIKLKLINESTYTSSQQEGKLYNSPWNIAADFKVDMSFSTEDISSMLNEYEMDYNTGMNINELSQEIYNYTAGYPFLVSRICQHIDEELNKDWTIANVQNAVKIILNEANTLFDDLFKNLENNKDLYNLIYDMLILGQQRMYSSYNPTTKLGIIFGIIKAKTSSDYLMISNRIFEIIICNYFITKDDEININNKITGMLQHDIALSGKFNMELCLRKFAKHYKEIYNSNNEDDIAFLERHGRLIFLSYLKPLINGQGFYHIESQFTDLRRMDIVVDYGTEQFIIELKRWYGDLEHDKAYEQLKGYLNSKGIDTGYLLTFDFRKDLNKQHKAEWIEIDGKHIFDVIV